MKELLTQLAIKHGDYSIEHGINGVQFTNKELQAFAQAVIEDYKASLVAVMWWDGDSDYPDDIMLPAIRQSHIDNNSSTYLDYPIPLYALKEQEK